MQHVGRLIGTLLTLAVFVRTPSAASFTVNGFGDAADANPGDGVAETAPGNGVTTLRSAIEETNALKGPDIITFAPSGTILPLAPLPSLNDSTGGTTIDGSGIVVLDGSLAGLFASGLRILTANNTLLNLQIVRWGGTAIVVSGSLAVGNRISGCFIGTDGSSAMANGSGIGIGSGASNNWVGGTTTGQRNVVSGNEHVGIGIGGAGTDGNVIAGNFVGTDATGKRAIGGPSVASRARPEGILSDPLQIGVRVAVGASGNTVGGLMPSERNIVSGNIVGVWISDQGTTSNLILGNYIGTDDTGTTVVRNRGQGVIINYDAAFNTVGGLEPGAKNLISGNFWGVMIEEGSRLGTRGNVVQGNIIGPDATGRARLGNFAGIEIDFARRENQIGGTQPGARNVISGNEIQIYVLFSSQLLIQGNYIGADVDGSPFLSGGPYGTGIFIERESTDNLIGGIEPGAGNLISGAALWGIVIEGTSCFRNQIRRNSIHDNYPRGIGLIGGANNGIQPAIVTSIFPVRGVAPPHSVVELFIDEEDEGEAFFDTVIANEAGSFLSDADSSALSGRNFTATATDAVGNTSEFGPPAGRASAPSWPRYR
jgi:hypothetical protein